MAEFTILKEDIRGRIVQPSDVHKYDLEIKKLWNACLHIKRPIALVQPREKDDVAKTVKFCVDNKLDICVCCGGTTEVAVQDNAVLIDLSLMCDVIVDVDNMTAVVEGGALVADVDQTLHKHGLVTPLGSFSKLGVAGMTLRGGFGFLTKCYGVTSDSVLEYELVTASGEVIKVNAEENQDLFWGMKGFGTKYGIVTSMKFKVYRMPDLIVGGTLYYPLSRAKEVVKTLLDYYERRNDNCLSFHAKCFVLPIGPEVLIKLHYNGSVTTGGEIVQDIEDLTHPIKNTCRPIAHCDFQSQGDEMLPSGKYCCAAPGACLSELKDEVVDLLIDGIQNVPDQKRSFTGTYVSIFALAAKSNKNLADGTSSYPFPGTLRFFLGMNGATDKEKNVDALKQWMKEVFSGIHNYGLPPFGGKPEEPEKRLKQLKLRYDPQNIFH
ncbi:FAD-linked oxidoreductase DDB_G0289697-like [Actinia tenebrosa]|uniref:FAD-linked oxidoreductase DDB_G0289697-like n=1 Tax=Actinia tenebrosa TaxID=6105 RepID=A0A6P8IL87_ACTTE|nr:FAD-linked oxidoreductase DDB_G0289697-like [Actinia tenebrosa]